MKRQEKGYQNFKIDPQFVINGIDIDNNNNNNNNNISQDENSNLISSKKKGKDFNSAEINKMGKKLQLSKGS